MPEPYLSCEWPVDPACFTDEWEALDEDTQDRCLALASATLRRLTGYRVGGCPVTVRPCKTGCPHGNPYFSGYGRWWPSVTGAGDWVNSCGCTGDCDCTETCTITLPAPIGEVYEVEIDGDPVPPEDYQIDGDRLVWTGTGDCGWPVCQDFTVTDGPGTFLVTYLNAWPVDGLGAYAAGVLALEYARACTGGKCRLPPSVTSIVRQGITMTIASGAFPNGLTGIREVDAYLALWNPGGLRQAATVWYPGVPSARVVR